MRREALTLAMLAVSAPALASVKLPAELHGTWDVSLGACADGEMAEGVRISADSLTYYESHITPLSLKREAAGQFVIVGDWNTHDEIDRTTARLKLSAEGMRLSVSYNGGAPEHLVRCAQPSAALDTFLQTRKTPNA